MALTAGSRLGSYEIVRPIGAGGMGEVYLARDTKLGRSVALKVLPEVFLADADRIGRLEREAKMLAALNHPRIAALHGMEECAGRHVLVMELVEGETLAERLRHGPLSVDEALRIAVQIAEAVEAAHEKGVVHRDLKPANVKITPDESVKVLDFGLAKATETEGTPGDISNSPTLSMMATQAGLILGTAAYMSPEQAKGFPATQRSDIFSFGAMFYEMLTGRQPFQGETAPEVLASVLVREPDIKALPPRLNPRLVDLLRRCLEKNPKRRWQAIGDVRAELETILATPDTTVDSAPAAAPPRSSWRWVTAMAFVALAASVLTAVVVSRRRPADRTVPVARFQIPLADGQAMTTLGRPAMAISKDGTRIVYTANGRLYVRDISELEARPIQGIETSAAVTSPVISPDGRSVVFWSADRTLKRIAMVGGAAVTLCEAENPLGMSWNESALLFAQTTGIMRVSESGGKPELLVSITAGFAYGPQMLPGGTDVLYTLAASLGPDQWDRAAVIVQTLRTGERKRVVEGGSDARYLSTGHLVYALGGTLFAAPFDLQRRELTRPAVPVLEGVRRAAAGSTGHAHFSVSDTGSLIYLTGPAGSSTQQFDIARVDRKGSIDLLQLSPGPYEYPRVSPDGKRIVFGTDDGRVAAVWVHSLTGTTSMRRLTFGGANRFPIWSADSERVAYQSDREGDRAIFWQRADGTGTVERLTKPEPETSHVPDVWSPDGKHLLFTIRTGLKSALWVYSLDDRQAKLFGGVESPALATPTFSPDGKWVAYTGSERGTNDTSLFVQPFPSTGEKYQLFAKRGDNPHHPRWSPDGKEIFYVPRVGGLEAVSVVTEPVFAFGTPAPAPRVFPVAAPTTPRTFDLTRDGRIISVIVKDQDGTAGSGLRQPITVVLNWLEEFQARLAARN